MHVLGRDGGDDGGPIGRLGRYRARDGSVGARVCVDLDRPHAALIVGKRGSGKSHTAGVLAEAAARAAGVAPVVLDPMGGFGGLAASADGDTVPAQTVEAPTVAADALDPSAWPELLGLDPAGAAGSLVWRAAAEAGTLAGMRERVGAADAERSVRRAAANHLDLAASWEVFDPDGLRPADLCGGAATVCSLAGLPPPAAAAVCAAVARGLYDARVDGTVDRLPWLFVDEAHAVGDGVAATPLRTLFTRGRSPGVAVVVATQRPVALPPAAVSQADLLFAHRLTAESDLDALAAASPTYLDGTLRKRIPDAVGEALVVDDAGERAQTVRVRERDTPHEGTTARASAAARGGRTDESGDGSRATGSETVEWGG